MNHFDPDGNIVWGIGISGTANAGVGGSNGTFIIWDDEGNVALVKNGYNGGGTPSLSGSFGVMCFPNTDTIFEFVSADVVDFGGSVSKLAVDFYLGYNKDKSMLFGIQAAYSKSVKILAEAHGGLSFTSPYKLLLYHGAGVPSNAQLDFFYGADEETRMVLKNHFGYSKPFYGFGGTKVFNSNQLYYLN